jgi:uncharacterized protein YbjT (DUF2867 family)
MTAADRVLLAGASGNTGQEVLKILRSTDLTVRALTSSSEKVEQLEQRGADEVIICDLMNQEDVASAVDGIDVVYTAVGSQPSEILFASEFVDGQGNINLVEAAANADVDAFVMESALGVDGDRASLMARMTAILIRPINDAKTRAERAIRESGLRYTILRPGILTSGTATTNVQVAPAETGLWGTVSRADVARLMVGAPFTPATANETLEVVHNPLVRRRSLDIDWQLP